MAKRPQSKASALGLMEGGGFYNRPKVPLHMVVLRRDFSDAVD